MRRAEIGRAECRESRRRNRAKRFSSVRPVLVREGHALGLFPLAPVFARGALLAPPDGFTRLVVRVRNPKDKLSGPLYEHAIVRVGSKK